MHHNKEMESPNATRPSPAWPNRLSFTPGWKSQNEKESFDNGFHSPPSPPVRLIMAALVPLAALADASEMTQPCAAGRSGAGQRTYDYHRLSEAVATL